jgi:hypothetical protein
MADDRRKADDLLRKPDIGFMRSVTLQGYDTALSIEGAT